MSELPRAGAELPRAGAELPRAGAEQPRAGAELPRIGVSSCLLGHRVRYDGAEKGIPWVGEELAAAVELVPICPEVGAGMPVPRPPIQLVRRPERGLRVELVEGQGDVHTALSAFCTATLVELEADPLDGYLFKARSPSCGVTDTPHFTETLEVGDKGAGLWARHILARWPQLPVADEADVQTEAGQREFLRRVNEYRQR